MKRRTLIKIGAVGVSTLFSPGLMGLARAGGSRDPFRRPFEVPPLDRGERGSEGVRFRFDLKAGESQFFANASTPTLGINGSFLGPTVRVNRGDRVQFEVRNQLKEETTLHWHGLVLPAKMDGGPHQVIAPGKSWVSEYEIVQPASMCWYHSHTHGKTGLQVYKGLAGLFIIDDDQGRDSELPGDYGVDDIPVVIQDRRFNVDGSFNYIKSMPDRMHGIHGSHILVNGVLTPTLKAVRSRLRLRVLNGSNARFYNLAFDDGRPFQVVASDGGFLPQAAGTTHLLLAPGERAEIVVDLSDRKTVVLESVSLSTRSGVQNSMFGGERLSIMRIDASQAELSKESGLIASSLPGWVQSEADGKRDFELEMTMGPQMMMAGITGKDMMKINGRSFDMNVINERVKANSHELWQISNQTMLAHPFHIHNTQFFMMGRSNGWRAAHESGLKDTIVIPSNSVVRVMVPFPEYADANYPYMYHCHILEHEDAGMMGQFTVEA